MVLEDQGAGDWVCVRQDIKIPVGITGSQKGLGWKDLKHHPVPPLPWAPSARAGCSHLVWKDSRVGVTKPSMCSSWMSRGIWGTATFQPGCGSQNRARSGSQQESVTPLAAGQGWMFLELNSGGFWLGVLQEGPFPLCPPLGCCSSPQLCIPAVPWQIFLTGMVGIPELPSPPSQAPYECFWCGNYCLIRESA